MKRVLGGFQHRVDRRLKERQLQKGRDRGCVYPLPDDAMAEAGLKEAETYISRLHNTVAQYISTRPIMDLCLAAKHRPWQRVEIRWWEKEGLDSEGKRIAVWEAKQT